mmetsp:Transcript_1369/g.2221  ORF Transcript_1369/g.2221 Transcript_1369/m.2221 type:complete len:107 (+) Transcript_1369:256-576(+)
MDLVTASATVVSRVMFRGWTLYPPDSTGENITRETTVPAVAEGVTMRELRVREDSVRVVFGSILHHQTGSDGKIVSQSEHSNSSGWARHWIRFHSSNRTVALVDRQ